MLSVRIGCRDGGVVMEYEEPRRTQVASLPFVDMGNHSRTAFHSVIQTEETDTQRQQRIAEELYRFYCEGSKKEAGI